MRTREAKEENRDVDNNDSNTHSATAIVAAHSLRDLARIMTLYPDVIDQQDADRLSKNLQTVLVTVAEAVGVSQLFEAIPIPDIREPDADVKFEVIRIKFVMRQGNFTAADASSDDTRNIVHGILEGSTQNCDRSVRSIADQIDRIKTFDCLWPSQHAALEFVSSRRTIQLLERYWTLVRRLLVHHVNAHATFRPHPLRLMLTSMARRFDLGFKQLRQLGLETKGAEIVDSFIDILLEADPDAFKVLKEWICPSLDVVDQLIDDLRKKIGIGIFELTFAEADFLDYAEKAIVEYIERVEESWSTWSNRTNKQRPNAESSVDTPPGPLQPSAYKINPKDLSPTKQLILQAALQLNAIDEKNCVFARQIGDKIKMAADNRLRADISDLRTLQLLGGKKGAHGYWLTAAGIECAQSLSQPKQCVPDTVMD